MASCEYYILRFRLNLKTLFSHLTQAIGYLLVTIYSNTTCSRATLKALILLNIGIFSAMLILKRTFFSQKNILLLYQYGELRGSVKHILTDYKAKNVKLPANAAKLGKSGCKIKIKLKEADLKI